MWKFLQNNSEWSDGISSVSLAERKCQNEPHNNRVIFIASVVSLVNLLMGSVC